MVGESNFMVGYHLMAEDHSMAAPWWELEFLEKAFEYKPQKDVWKAKNRYILSLRMKYNGTNSYSQYMQRLS